MDRDRPPFPPSIHLTLITACVLMASTISPCLSVSEVRRFGAGSRLRRQLPGCLTACVVRSPRGLLLHIWSTDIQPRTISLGTGLSSLFDHRAAGQAASEAVRRYPSGTAPDSPVGHATGTRWLPENPRGPVDAGRARLPQGRQHWQDHHHPCLVCSGLGDGFPLVCHGRDESAYSTSLLPGITVPSFFVPKPSSRAYMVGRCIVGSGNEVGRQSGRPLHTVPLSPARGHAWPACGCATIPTPRSRPTGWAPIH